MKSLRISLPVILISTLLFSISTVVSAQTESHKPVTQAGAPKSDAQKSFDQLKTLAGSWQASVTTDPPMKDMGNGEKADVLLRVASRGNSLVHEMGEAGKQDDPTKYDHPVTMFYLENDRLVLTHYCDAGNRPRLAARTSPDGKTLEFDFLDVTGNTQYGHMYHAVFTFIDENHHTEDWTFKLKGDKLMRAHLDLQRVSKQAVISQK